MASEPNPITVARQTLGTFQTKKFLPPKNAKNSLTPHTLHLFTGLLILRAKRTMIYIFYLYIQWLKPTMPIECAMFTF